MLFFFFFFSGREVKVVVLTCFLIMTICKVTSVFILELCVTKLLSLQPEMKLIALNFTVKVEEFKYFLFPSSGR